MKLRITIYIVVFFFCGAVFGLWFGQKSLPGEYVGMQCRPVVQGELDRFYTQVLNTSDGQQEELLGIEQRYQGKRDQFTRRMHDINRHLADVIEQEGYESKKIPPLVAEIHTAMGELQNLSLTHLAAIEKVLEPEQAMLLKQRAVARLRHN